MTRKRTSRLHPQRQQSRARAQPKPTHLLVEARGNLGTDTRRKRLVAECNVRAAGLADLRARARKGADQPNHGVLRAALELGLGRQRVDGERGHAVKFVQLRRRELGHCAGNYAGEWSGAVIEVRKEWWTNSSGTIGLRRTRQRSRDYSFAGDS